MREWERNGGEKSHCLSPGARPLVQKWKCSAMVMHSVKGNGVCFHSFAPWSMCGATESGAKTFFVDFFHVVISFFYFRNFIRSENSKSRIITLLRFISEHVLSFQSPLLVFGSTSPPRSLCWHRWCHFADICCISNSFLPRFSPFFVRQTSFSSVQWNFFASSDGCGMQNWSSCMSRGKKNFFLEIFSSSSFFRRKWQQRAPKRKFVGLGVQNNL